MTKYHVNSKGEPGACTATKGQCPFGGEGDHFDSIRDAATAAMEAKFDADNPAPEAKPLTPKQRWEEFESRNHGESVIVPEEDRAAFYEVFIDSIARDVRGMGIAHFATPGKDLEGLTDAEFAALLDAQQKPMRLTAAEKKRRDEVCRTYKVSPEDVEAWAAANPAVNTVVWRGQEVAFHPSRHLSLHDTMGSFGSTKRTYGYTEGNVAQAAAWKRDQLVAAAEAKGRKKPTRQEQIEELERKARLAGVMAQTAETRKENIAYINEREALNRQIADLKARGTRQASARTDDDRDPRHPYGQRRAVQEGGSSGRSSSGPKELDPAMIEALKLKYLKKFKIPFDESGLSVGELLQMAQRGELG